MYKFLLLLLFTGIVFFCQAQSRGFIEGKIIDSASKAPIELATIAIINVKDTASSLVSYTLTDKNGAFALHSLPPGIPLKLLITFISYNPVRKFFTLSKNENINMGTIALSKKQLHEISITGERPPVIIKGDTIEFNAEAFKTRPNAIVEELLKKLPGIEVDNAGNITVNGKAVSKIMIDGKEFFSNDPKIASKNLDAALIDKVQVYDDREDDPDHLIQESKVNKIINLKFKKALKKSVFGKIYAGAGTQGRFETGGLLNMFRDTLQVSLIGLGNNLNKTGFSRDELYNSGGFNRAGDNLLNNGNIDLGGTGYGGIQTVATAGFNINYDYGKKLKLNLIYFFSRTQNVNYYKVNSRQYLPGDTLTTSGIYTGNSTDNKHSFNFYLKWQPDTLTQIKFNPILTLGNSQNINNELENLYSYLIPNISYETNGANSSGSSLSYHQILSYYHRFKKQGESITISQRFSIDPDINNNISVNNLLSFTPASPSDSINRYANKNNKNTAVNLTASYRYPLTKKLTTEISLAGDYNYQGGNLLTYNFNRAENLYNIYIDTLSSNLNRYQKTAAVHPEITYNFTKKISLIAGISTQWQQINNQFNKNIPDLDQNYFFVLPNLRLTLGDVSLSYDADISQPSIDDLQPIKTVFSPLYSYTGNPDLKPTKRNTFYGSYYSYNAEKQITINYYSSATFEQNSIYRQLTLNNIGAQTSRPINKDGQYNGNVGIGFGKKFKKINAFTFGSETNISASTSHNFFQINLDEGFQNNNRVDATQSFTINWNDKLELDPSYTISRSITNYTGVNYNNISTTTQSVDTKLNVYLPHKFSVESSYTYTYNPLVTPGFQRSINLLSLSFARQLLKNDQGQIKLSCYDIFNQNINAYRYSGQNAVTDVESQILQRYFLLTLQFKFNKAITK